MPRTRVHHDARRRELAAIAEQVFIRHGYAETSLADLLKATGLSKGGFYHYFDSKDDVLRETVTAVLDEAAVVIDEAAASDASPTEQLSAIFRGMRELRSRHSEFAPILTVVIGDTIPARAFAEDAIRTLAPSLSQVIARFPVSHPRQTAELILDVLTAFTRHPDRDTYRADPEAMKAYISALRELVGGALGLGPDNPALAQFGW